MKTSNLDLEKTYQHTHHLYTVQLSNMIYYKTKKKDHLLFTGT